MVQRDATGCSLFYFTAKITLHVSGVCNAHHQEYIKLITASGTGHSVSTATSLQYGQVHLATLE
jgi:hypothetical protein